MDFLLSSNSSKKRMKNSIILLIGKKTNSFVRFLEESSAGKKHYDFVWPLVLSCFFFSFIQFFLGNAVTWKPHDLFLSNYTYFLILNRRLPLGTAHWCNGCNRFPLFLILNYTNPVGCWQAAYIALLMCTMCALIDYSIKL